MFKQIIVAMAGAIAAQITAATLDFAPAERHDYFEPHPAAVQLVAVPGTSSEFFAAPAVVSTVVPFLGPPR